MPLVRILEPEALDTAEDAVRVLHAVGAARLRTAACATCGIAR